MEIILASSSPRRRSLLEELGLEVTVRPADIDETPRPGEVAADYVERLAREKAEAIDAHTEHLVIAADTIVVLDGELLGKPANDDQARSYLQRLSGRTHDVMTGVSLRFDGVTSSTVERSSVHFATLSADDIEWYVGTREPTDKAGAYAIQGRGGLFVSGIEGSYDNVIGLPRHTLRQLADERGVDLLRGRMSR